MHVCTCVRTANLKKRNKISNGLRNDLLIVINAVEVSQFQFKTKKEIIINNKIPFNI